MKTINIGIIGSGRIGQLHAENIINKLPQFNLVLVADPFVDEQWAKKHNISISTSIDDIMDNKDIDSVLICSPSKFHVEQIIQAARYGKNIFCEKPVGLSEEEIIASLRAVDEAKVKLQVGFNRRFDNNFAKIQSQVANGAIGNPHIVRITSRDPDFASEEYIKSSGGIFMDMTIHDFDMARFLAGSEVTEVYAVGQNLIDPVFKKYDDYDTAVVHLKFANGALGVIDNSRKAVYGYDQRVEVFSNKGCLMANNVNNDNVTFMGEKTVETAKPLYFFLERYEQAFVDQLKSFHEAIVNDQKPIVDGYDGLQALRIATAAKKSAQTGIPVQVTAGL